MGRVVAVLFVMAVAQGVRGSAPLTTADVIRCLRAGLSEGTILSELGDCGFAEPLDPAREAALREAGATETLVAAVRRAAPAEERPAPHAAPPPPRAAPDGPLAVSPPSGAHGPTFAASTRTVRVPVSVLDNSGRPVMGLRGEDFRVWDDGKPQPVTLFSADRRPLRVVVALDVSGSMGNKIRQVEEALKRFIDLLEPADEIMVITFSNRVHIVQDFTPDRDLLARVLERLHPAGATALYDAALEAIRRVAAGPAEGKAVVLVTDGMDTASTISFDALREFARRSEVPVFSIGLGGGTQVWNVLRPPGRFGPGGGKRWWPDGGGGGRPRWPGGGGGRGGWPDGAGSGGPGGRGPGGPSGMGREGFDGKPLVELADETGARAEILRDKGLPHYAPDSDTPKGDRLKEAVESIAMTLRHRYLLGYEPPEGKRGWRTIRVDVERPAATARARKGYYAGG